MSLPSLEKAAPPSNRPSALIASPAVSTDDLDGPLCALAVYLSAAERLSEADEIDRTKLGHALRGAGEQLAEVTRRTAAACDGQREAREHRAPLIPINFPRAREVYKANGPDQADELIGDGPGPHRNQPAASKATTRGRWRRIEPSQTGSPARAGGPVAAPHTTFRLRPSA